MIKIGKHLKKLREEKKISQEELSILLNISQKTISNWESDKGFPKITQLSILEKVLHIDILSWIKENEIAFNPEMKCSVQAETEKTIEKLINQYEMRIEKKDHLIYEQSKLIKILLENYLSSQKSK